MTGAPHRVDLSSVMSLRVLVKPWLQNNHEWLTKNTAVVSPASAEERCTGQPRCLVLSEGRMNCAVSQRSLVGHVILKSSCCSVGYCLFKGPGTGSHKSTIYFGLGNRRVSIPERSRVSRWITDDMEMEDGRVSTCGEPSILLLFLLFFPNILCNASAGTWSVFRFAIYIYIYVVKFLKHECSRIGMLQSSYQPLYLR